MILASFMSIVNRSFADCTKESNGFVFLHPVFNNTYWKFLSDSMNITIPQQLCDEKPYRYFTSGTADSSAGLIIDSTGAVSILIARFSPKECQCCSAKVVLSNPVATTLKIEKDLPASFVMANSSLNLLYFAYFTNITTIAVASISKEGTVIKTDQLSLTNATGKSIQAISSVSNTDLNGFWVSGTNGLVRYLPVTASGLGTIVNYDIQMTTDTLISVSSNYSFTTNGGVYEWSNGELVKSISLPIRGSFANESIVANNTTIMARYGNGWKSAAYSSGMLHGANVIRSYKGVYIEYIGKTWEFNTVKLFDSSTAIKTIQPSTMMQYINKGEYVYSFNKAETLSVVMMDPDSNSQLPGITVGSTSIFNNSDYDLFGKGLDLPCAVGTAKMYTDSFKVILRPDSVVFESNFLLGVNNILCNTANWSKRKLRFTYPFLPRLLKISVGNDLIIVNDQTVSVKINNENSISGIDLCKRQNAILCKFKNRQHSAGYLSLWTIDGKLIAKKHFTISTSELVIPYVNKNRMVLAIVNYSDGKSENHKLILTSP